MFLFCLVPHHRILSRGHGKVLERKCLFRVCLTSVITISHVHTQTHMASADLYGIRTYKFHHYFHYKVTCCKQTSIISLPPVQSSSIKLFISFFITMKPVPLFSSFKILWLTLCQLHNPMEIEVSVSVIQYLNTSAQLYCYWIIIVMSLLLVFTSLHSIRRGEGKPCHVCQ